MEGRIDDFDKENVTIIDKYNRRITVLRKNIPSHFEVKPGNEVFAVVKTDALVKKIQESKTKQMSTPEKTKSVSDKKN